MANPIRAMPVMKGSRPGNLPHPSRPVESGVRRVCRDPDCDTKLSVYNAGDFCWQHTDLVFPNYRGKRLSAK